MTRENLRKIHKELDYFIEGGDLWYYDEVTSRWYKQNEFVFGTNSRANIIGDEHVKIRQAFALGKVIQCSFDFGWYDVDAPDWGTNDYRVKPEEPVYEYQFYRKRDQKFVLTEKFYTEMNISGYTKFEPSKRLKKQETE